MANPTTNLGMTKPTVGGSTDTWGITLNEEVIDILDAVFASTGTAVSMGNIGVDLIAVEAQGDIRLGDAASTSASGALTGDYVAIQAATTIDTSYTITMPAAVGSSGQALRSSDGAGTLEWYTPSDVGDITEVVAGAGLTGGGTSGVVTLNAIGNADRITVNANDIDIASTYVGQTSITTLGTVATGTWEGTTVAVDQGGTGATSLTADRILLGDGTSAIKVASALSDGEVLIGNGSGAPTTLDLGSSTSVTILGTIATGVWQGTTVGVGYGGTGLASYTAGDILYASGTTTLAKLAKGSDTEVLTLASGVPTWAAPTVGDITAVTAGAGMTGGGSSGDVTLNVIGTADRITVNADDVDIASTYVGQTSITTLGTVATGVWNGTAITGDYIDATTSPLANTKIWIGDSSGDAQEFALSGDATMTAGGAVSVTAPAGDLTGTTLKSTVVSSSLTSVGTIATGVWNGTALATAYIADNAVTLAKLEDGTSGDILYYAASGVPTRLAKGSDTEVLTLSSGLPVWSAPTTGDITGVTAGAGMTGGGTSGDVTLNVIGTADRITVNADDVDIASTYVGQTSITTLGTVATGTWNGTAITGAYVDATSSPLANTKIWIGSASNVAAEFALSGDATMTAGGAVTVSSAAACTGNAATATALATARAINGTDFDGTAAITVTAAAGTLTGATLNSGVTASSLTSTGTLGSLTVTNDLVVDTDTLFVDASEDKVGIGTTTPASYEDGADYLAIVTTGDSGMTIASGTSNNGLIHFADGTTGDAKYRGIIKYRHGTNNDMIFSADATVSLTLTSTGAAVCG